MATRNQVIEQTEALRDRVIDLAAELVELTAQLRETILKGEDVHGRAH